MERTSGRFDLDAMIQRIIEEKDRERQNAVRRQDISSSGTSADGSASGIEDGQSSSNLYLEERAATTEGRAGQNLSQSHRGGNLQQLSEPSDALNETPEGSLSASEYGDNASGQVGMSRDTTLDPQGVPDSSLPSFHDATRNNLVGYEL